ncbi:MAG TPA: DUF4249 family protein [Gemmatimonadaceae bacterium]|nr:DUF4249 family protein [Gemmatimonadaceae bacterium]
MRIERAAIALVAASSLAACVEKSPTEPAAHALVVHAVLDASARDQYVVVQSTNGATASATGVTGAVVTLSLPDGRNVRAAEERDSVHAIASFDAPRLTTIYHFSLDQLGFTVVPGATYQLRVAVPDGRVVTGQTTVPSTTPVTTPESSQPFTLLRDTLRLSWSRVSGARSYEVSVVSVRGPTAIFADTSIALTGQSSNMFGDDLFPFVGTPGQGTPYRVIVSAVDGNYYDYYRRSSDFFSGAGVIEHLDGALGVFGSLVPIVSKQLAVK